MSVLQEEKVLKEISNEEYSTVVKVYFKTGDKIKKGDTILELETSKAVFSIEAKEDGCIEYFCKEGDNVPIGMVIVRIYDDAKDIKVVEKIDNIVSAVGTSFSSSALELIKKEKLDKNIFSGRDFINAEDVQRFIKSQQAGANENIIAKESIDLNDLINSGQIRLQKISKAKQLEIFNLRNIQSANMNCIVAVNVDTEGIYKFAEKNLSIFKDSILSFIIFETSRLLKKYHEFNAFFAEQEIAFYNSVNIGLAIDIGSGLKVVKLANTDKKSVKEIEVEILEIANKYLDKKLKKDDVSGITFTVTDLSREEVVFFTPLINKRQSAILGISSVDAKLNRCILTLTFDHRVTEGKKASEFLNELKIKLENYNVPNSKDNENVSGYDYREIKCFKCLKTLEEVRRFNGVGLLRVVDCDGKEKFLCEICFLGW